MRASRGRSWGILLGVSLGGFFDGILLHQILQWHHLLSLVADPADIRQQVLWDGYFHALMYLIAAAGLAGLWLTWRRGAMAGGRDIAGALLIGFGLWHVADALLSHWLLGLHRVKLDSDSPLLWDLGWLAAFGVVPMIAGFSLLRSQAKRSGTGMRPRFLAVITAGVFAGAAWSFQPPPGQPLTAVVFPAGQDPAAAFAALAATDARLVWSDPDMGMIVVDVAVRQRWRFYRHGAVLVSGAGLPVGCFGWARA